MCPSRLSYWTARGLGLPLAHLAHSHHSITRIRRAEPQASTKSFKGQTFISCSSWSCRRLRSSSSSSSRLLDLRLVSAPSSTANTTSHVSPREGGLGLKGLGHLCSTCQVSKVSSGRQHSWTTQGKKKKSLLPIQHPWLASWDREPYLRRQCNVWFSKVRILAWQQIWSAHLELGLPFWLGLSHPIGHWPERP